MRLAGNIYTGPLTDDTWLVLKTAWKRGGIALQCDLARQYSIELALCASQGWVSTVDPDGKSYRNRWRITSSGLTMLKHKDMT